MTNSFGGLSVQKPKPPSKGGVRERSSPKTAIQKGEALASKMRSAKKSELLNARRLKYPGPNGLKLDIEMQPL